MSINMIQFRARVLHKDVQTFQLQCNNPYNMRDIDLVQLRAAKEERYICSVKGGSVEQILIASQIVFEKVYGTPGTAGDRSEIISMLNMLCS